MQTGNNNVRLPTRLNTNTRADSRQNKPFAVPADVETVLEGEMEPRPHRYLSCHLNISLGKVRPILNRFLGKLEEHTYSEIRYSFPIASHVPLSLDVVSTNGYLSNQRENTKLGKENLPLHFYVALQLHV